MKNIGRQQESKNHPCHIGPIHCCSTDGAGQTQGRWFDSLRQRFNKAKFRLDAVMAEIQKRQAQRADIDAFLKAFRAMPDTLLLFTPEAWQELVDFITVYSDDDIRITFRNGQEIQA